MKKTLLLVLSVCIMLMATTASAEENPEIHESAFQISFITPLGTNGIFSHLTINTVSINILGGYSYGNTALELGGLYNINTHITKGFQFANIFNYSGNVENAFQFAGLANIAAKGTVSSQVAGILNTASSVKGAQISGIANITANKVNGAQFAGILNIASEVDGVQVAGNLNVANEVKGSQFSIIANSADEVSGIQLGILNVANVVFSQFGIENMANEVSSQFGVSNSARKVRGVQLGLFNYAEEVDGVSIGLINIVKNGGKQEFEISFSEVLTTAISFRLGTDKFYTIFSGGIKYLPTSSVEYAYGLGFGTHIDWVQGWGNQIELLTHSVTEDGKIFGGINNLSQLKFTVSKEFAKYFKVFAGPVLNLSASTYKNPKTGKLDSSIAPWSMWKTEFRGTQLNLWVGFSLGVRF